MVAATDGRTVQPVTLSYRPQSTRRRDPPEMYTTTPRPTDRAYRHDPSLFATAVAAILPLVALLAVAYPVSALSAVTGALLATVYAHLRAEA